MAARRKQTTIHYFGAIQLSAASNERGKLISLSWWVGGTTDGSASDQQSTIGMLRVRGLLKHGSAPQYLAKILHLTSDTQACRRLYDLALYVDSVRAGD